jgi:hypothetical protein
LLAGRLENDQRFSDEASVINVFRTNSTGNVVLVQSSDFDVRYRSQLEVWTGEFNQLFRGDRSTLILGGRFQVGEFETRNTLTNVTLRVGFFPPVDQTVREDFQRWSLYGYDTWELARNRLWLTAGISYDRMSYPQNHRQVPISAGESTTDLVGRRPRWSGVR